MENVENVENLEPIYLGFYMNLETSYKRKFAPHMSSRIDDTIKKLTLEYSIYLVTEQHMKLAQAEHIAKVVLEAYKDSAGDFKLYMRLCKTYFSSR